MARSDSLPPLPAPVLRRVEVAGRDLLVLDEGHGALPYGGNKVRKLHGILELALSRGMGDLVTFGAWGSHHVYATAVWGARVGLRTHAVWIRQPETDHVRRVARASHQACASVRAVRSMAELPVATGAAVAAVLRDTGRAPLQIPPGGSSVVGTRGWVALGRQLPDALAARGWDAPDAIVVASGSGGTAAGLLAAGWPVHAVRVGPRTLTNGPRLQHLARRAGASARGPLQVEHGYGAGGYGRYDARTEDALEAGRVAGLPVETTYTAKALAAALDLARAGRRVLFVQTASASEPPDAPPLPAGLLGALGLSGSPGRGPAH